jgi:hypothetical protein
MLDRGAKAEILGEHDKLQHVPAQAASEAKPTPRCLEHVQVWTTAVGVKRTPSDERMSLSPELDPVTRYDVFDGMRQFEGSRIDPSRRRCDTGNLERHPGQAT